ncbi:MAG: serine hydrolase [Candidatus Marinimicrobia bacterium]|nr:serine hydrolase [Candidatus Neomarinimicrobiota bacterium]
MKKITVIVLLIFLILLSSCERKDIKTVDTIIQSAIEERVFPGAVLLVGNSDNILYQKAYGNFTYAKDSKKVEINSIFDMASLTKVFATGMSIMKCIDSGLVDPETPVVKYLPDFDNHGKDIIKVKHLLMHNSGLPAYVKAGKTADETLDIVMNIEMVKEPDDYKYSCLNFITLMRVVESATGMKMWEFYKETYTDPMNMERTMFSPDEEMKEYCLPTIGDSTGISILLQSEVHDPLALSLEGYSGNAGLFSIAPDLAKFCQMMLNKGKYNGHRYVSEKTIKPFITLQAGTRAYAWGMNNYRSSAGDKLSETAIGHTGYTGTCAWIDHEKDIFIVFLTNRVYPQDKKAVTPVRRKVNDAVVEAVLGF